MPRRNTTVIMKRALRGLYHNRQVNKVHRVSQHGKKFNRRQLPNAGWSTLYSSLLEERIRVRTTARALRCIDKRGGLDNYLLTTNENLIPGLGLRLKKRVAKAAEEKNVDLMELRRSLRRTHILNTPETIAQKQTKRKGTTIKSNPWIINAAY